MDGLGCSLMLGLSIYDAVLVRTSGTTDWLLEATGWRHVQSNSTCLPIFTHSSNQCSVIQYSVWSTDSYIGPVSAMDEVDRVHASWASSLWQHGQKLLWLWAVWTVRLYWRRYSLWSVVLHQWGKKQYLKLLLSIMRYKANAALTD